MFNLNRISFLWKYIRQPVKMRILKKIKAMLTYCCIASIATPILKIKIQVYSILSFSKKTSVALFDKLGCIYAL